MSFTDIFDQAFLEGYSGYELTFMNLFIAIIASAFLAGYIFYYYRKVNINKFYDKRFNVALGVITIILTGVMLALQSNLIISLGMVGALSIIRFRTAIKDVMDLVFLFWAIATGVICGTGLVYIAFLLGFLVTITMMVLAKIPLRNESVIIEIAGDDELSEKSIENVLKESCDFYEIKSRTYSQNSIELIIGAKLTNIEECSLKLRTINCVSNISIRKQQVEVF